MSDGVFPEFGNMTQVLWCIKPVFTNSVDYWWNLICLLKSEDISCLQEAGQRLTDPALQGSPSPSGMFSYIMLKYKAKARMQTPSHFLWE